jgi:hypothetical protein
MYNCEFALIILIILFPFFLLIAFAKLIEDGYPIFSNKNE